LSLRNGEAKPSPETGSGNTEKTKERIEILFKWWCEEQQSHEDSVPCKNWRFKQALEKETDPAKKKALKEQHLAELKKIPHEKIHEDSRAMREAFCVIKEHANEPICSRSKGRNIKKIASAKPSVEELKHKEIKEKPRVWWCDLQQGHEDSVPCKFRRYKQAEEKETDLAKKKALKEQHLAEMKKIPREKFVEDSHAMNEAFCAIKEHANEPICSRSKGRDIKKIASAKPSLEELKHKEIKERPLKWWCEEQQSHEDSIPCKNRRYKQAEEKETDLAKKTALKEQHLAEMKKIPREKFVEDSHAMKEAFCAIKDHANEPICSK